MNESQQDLGKETGGSPRKKPKRIPGGNLERILLESFMPFLELCAKSREESLKKK